MTQLSRESLLTEKGRPLGRRLLGALAIFAAVALAVRLFLMIDRYAIDVPFWDQFAFYIPLWERHGFWAMFNFQHGPHRMGLGLPIMHAINGLFEWNQRAQAFAIGATMVVAALTFLWAKKRLFSRLEWHDLAIPAVILTIHQWALYADCINLSHGALPVLLVAAISLCFAIPQPLLRYTLIGVLTFIATYTGFGFFACVAVPAVLIARAIAILWDRGWRTAPLRRELFALGLGLALCVITLLAFFHDYVWNPAAPQFVFPHPRPLEYLWFMGLEFAYTLGAKTVAARTELAGSLLFFAVCLACAHSLLRIARQRTSATPLPYVIFFLTTFSLAFAANAAVGRVCLGLDGALTSRYGPLLMPGIIGFYLYILTFPWPRPRVILAGLFILTAIVTTFGPKDKLVRHYSGGKARWVQAYRQTEDVYQADLAAGFQIFPDLKMIDIRPRLAWLKKHKLSLYRDLRETPPEKP